MIRKKMKNTIKIIHLKFYPILPFTKYHIINVVGVQFNPNGRICDNDLCRCICSRQMKTTGTICDVTANTYAEIISLSLQAEVNKVHHNSGRGRQEPPASDVSRIR